MASAGPIESTEDVPRDVVAEAEAFIESSTFVWHQRFPLAEGVWTPGENDVAWLVQQCGIPADLSGMRVLDIGTSNGGVAFELEARGASDVVATDIFPRERFGFDQVREFLGSNASFVQASVYELEKLGSFDLIFFSGVLYHLRHPLLALDKIRAASLGEVYLETAVADWQLEPPLRDASLVAFYRRDELGGDTSNWFAPTTRALVDWCVSSGFDTTVLGSWPAEAPTRALVKLVRTEGDPEFAQISYERPEGRMPEFDEPGAFGRPPSRRSAR